MTEQTQHIPNAGQPSEVSESVLSVDATAVDAPVASDAARIAFSGPNPLKERYLTAEERAAQAQAAAAGAVATVEHGAARVADAASDGGHPHAQPMAKEGERPLKRDARTARMGTASIPKLLIEFAIPAIVGMLVNGAYNLIDSIFLGQAMGEIGLSVATAAMPLMTAFLALAMLIGNGGNALAALRLGEGDREAAERTLGNTVMLGIIISAVVLVLVSIPPVMEFLLTLSSTTDEIHDMTSQFFYILAAGLIFNIIGFGVNNFIRTAGAPNVALLTMVVGTVVCIVLNWLFVLVLGWGVVGSALATVMGHGVSCACVIAYFTVVKDVPLKLHKRYLPLDFATVKTILALGTASFAMQVAFAVVNGVINYMLVLYGSQHPMGAEAALASIGIVQRVGFIAFLPIMGVAIAAQPLLGFNYGAGNIPRVRTTLGYAILFATILGTCTWGIVQLFAGPIVGVFGLRDPSLVDFTSFALRVQQALLLVVGFQVVTSQYFQATGQPAKSIVLSLTRQVLFLIPLYIALPIWLPVWVPTLTSLDAIYFAVPIADALAIITSLVFLIWELYRLKKIESGEIEAKFGRKHA